MKIEDIGKVINNIESRYEVDKWEVGGIKIWPLIRLENNSLLNFKVLNSKPTNTRSFSFVKKTIAARYRQIVAEFKDSKMNAKVEQSDVVLFGDGISSAKYDDKWFQKFCDPIYNYYKKEGIKSFRFDLAHEFLIPRYSPSRYTQAGVDGIIIKSLLYSKVSKAKFDSEIWGDYNEFLNDPYVREHFLVYPSKDLIRNRVLKIKNLKDYYTKYLLVIKPKVAFIVCYYADTCLAFIEACRALNIKTVDLQHGVQGDGHFAYSKWSNVPKNGYSLLPDYFWVWSDDDKKTIDKWNKDINNHQAIICGNAFQSYWRNDDDPLVKKYDQIFIQRQKLKDYPSLLLTLSPGINTPELMGQTWEIVKSTQFEYNWLIRLHPVMIYEKNTLKKEIEKYGIINYDMDSCSELPLYSLLRNIDVHITTQSSVVIEAAEFGVKSIITSEYGEFLYKSCIRDRTAYFCKSKENIEFKLKEILNSAKIAKANDRYSENVFNVFNQIINNAK